MCSSQVLYQPLKTTYPRTAGPPATSGATPPPLLKPTMYTREVSRKLNSFVASKAARYAFSSVCQSRSTHFGPSLPPTPGLFTRNVASPDRAAKSHMSCVQPSSSFGSSTESQLNHATSNKTGIFPALSLGRVRNTSNGYPSGVISVDRNVSATGLDSRPTTSCFELAVSAAPTIKTINRLKFTSRSPPPSDKWSQPSRLQHSWAP